MEQSRENMVFLHIEKAGGSTLHNILTNYYNPETILHLEYMSNGEMELSKVDCSKLKLVKGHITFEVMAKLANNWKCYSMLREPKERVISYYYYVKQKASHHHSTLIQENKWSLKEYILKSQNLQMDNGQVRYISGSHKPFGKIDGSDLDLAKFNIENHFLAVGLTERFDESLIILKNLLGWKRSPVYELANVNTNKKTIHEIDENDINAILEMNKFDLELYEFVKKRFGNDIGNDILKSDLIKLRRDTRIYNFKKNIKNVFSIQKKSNVSKL
jgi:hypothetical protein